MAKYKSVFQRFGQIQLQKTRHEDNTTAVNLQPITTTMVSTRLGSSHDKMTHFVSVCIHEPYEVTEQVSSQGVKTIVVRSKDNEGHHMVVELSMFPKA